MPWFDTIPWFGKLIIGFAITFLAAIVVSAICQCCCCNDSPKNKNMKRQGFSSNGTNFDSNYGSGVPDTIVDVGGYGGDNGGYDSGGGDTGGFDGGGCDSGGGDSGGCGGTD